MFELNHIKGVNMKPFSFVSILCSLLFFTFSLKAEVPYQWEMSEVNFSYSASNAYYACSYVERKLTEYVLTLGGEVFSVRCSGGLPDLAPIFLTATINSARFSESGPYVGVWLEQSLQIRDSCDINRRLLTNVLNHFETDGIHIRGICDGPSGRVTANFSILLPN